MSYTNPLGYPQGSAISVTNLLRQVIISEIVAINAYQLHILNSNIPEINDMWHHIMLDEKSHYAIAIDLLRKYDPAEYKYFVTPHEEKACVKIPLQVYNASYDKQIILNNIRDDVKGELEAVILFEDILPKIQQKDVRAALKGIIDDEKEHTEHLTQILLKYDPDPYAA